jgi:hypothetical protein
MTCTRRSGIRRPRAGCPALDRAEAEAFGEHLWSCARCHRIMEITGESPGDAGQRGKVVLKGTVSGG